MLLNTEPNTFQEEQFHGFSDQEIRLAGLKSELVQTQSEQCREDIWACKGKKAITGLATSHRLVIEGVALDPEERAVIRRDSVEGGAGVSFSLLIFC